MQREHVGVYRASCDTESSSRLTCFHRDRGPSIDEPHWSCCGLAEYHADCTLEAPYEPLPYGTTVWMHRVVDPSDPLHPRIIDAGRVTRVHGEWALDGGLEWVYKVEMFTNFPMATVPTVLRRRHSELHVYTPPDTPAPAVQPPPPPPPGTDEAEVARHTGTWHASGLCSTLARRLGRYCEHRITVETAMEQPHWSCCGALQYHSACTQSHAEPCPIDEHAWVLRKPFYFARDYTRQPLRYGRVVARQYIDGLWFCGIQWLSDTEREPSPDALVDVELASRLIVTRPEPPHAVHITPYNYEPVLSVRRPGLSYGITQGLTNTTLAWDERLDADMNVEVGWMTPHMDRTRMEDDLVVDPDEHMHFCSMCRRYKMPRLIYMPCMHAALCDACDELYQQHRLRASSPAEAMYEATYCPVCRAPAERLTEDRMNAGRTCCICLDTFPLITDTVALHGCSHTVCVGCLVHYVAMANGDALGHRFPLKCPIVDCGASIQVTQLHRLLCQAFPTSTFIDFTRYTQESRIPRDRRTYCPRCTRATVRRVETETGHCVHCDYTFCGLCQTDLHPGVSHDDNQASQARGEEHTERLIGDTAKRCPHCQTPITHYRNHGCHCITCRVCSTDFCYMCLSTAYDHDTSTIQCDCARGCSDAIDPPCPCPSCPDCRFGASCHDCDGCASCSIENAV
jgi:ribosomal protein L37AE/L43A